MIDARDVSIVRDGRYLLQAVSLEVHPGEVVALIGPNGAGKTTLVKALSGEWEPDEGSVLLHNTPLRSYSERRLARCRAVLGQDLSLAFPFTVFEIAMLGRIPYEGICTREENERIALQALGMTEADAFLTRLYPTLSGGERQRVQLARVLAQIDNGKTEAGQFLLMDEPTANQDLAHQHQLLSLVRNRADDRVGILVVLHDLNLAARYADRLVLLSEGHRIAAGKPEHILTSGTIGEIFGIDVTVMQHPKDGRPLVVVDRM